jgi:oligopeptide/dipeptide ABC transporter ATP-binding protein
MADTPLLELDDVSKTYRVPGPGLMSAPRPLRAVANASLKVFAGTSVGLVGESGCGKSTLAKIAAGFVAPSSGRALVFGEPQRDARGRIAPGRRRFQMVFQDPLAALDSRISVGDQVEEAVIIARGTAEGAKARSLELLRQVGLNEVLATRYPHELSGGEQQRVAIARALAPRPRLLICDEPVSSLDVSVQAQILNLMNELRKSLGLTLLFISHQLSTVRYLCDEVVVMYAGRVVEQGRTAELFSNPQHPYSRMLLSTALDPRMRDRREEQVVGEPPNPMALPPGCPFHPRCALAQREPCATQRPELRTLSNNIQAACHFA